MQLHCDYREYRPCATDPVEAQFQYHFLLLAVLPLAGRGAGVEAFGFGAVPALDMGAFALAAGAGVIRFGCGVLVLLIGFGAGFGCGLQWLPPMVTLRLILALSRWSLVSLVNASGRIHAYPGKRVIEKGLPLYTCVQA